MVRLLSAVAALCISTASAVGFYMEHNEDYCFEYVPMHEWKDLHLQYTIIGHPDTTDEQHAMVKFQALESFSAQLMAFNFKNPLKTVESGKDVEVTIEPSKSGGFAGMMKNVPVHLCWKKQEGAPATLKLTWMVTETEKYHAPEKVAGSSTAAMV